MAQPIKSLAFSVLMIAMFVASVSLSSPVSQRASGDARAAQQTDVRQPESDGGGIAGTTCGPGAGSCFVAHPTPGCNLFNCCISVCQVDPFCCDTQWDNFCVATANQLCASCGGVAAGSCYSANVTPACSDLECCQIVCAQDSFCCTTQWDNICAGAANQMCVCGGLGTGDCFVQHSTPWCNHAVCCDTVCAWNPFCCDVAWDASCVADANDFCFCGSPGSSSCFHQHNFPWCRRGECCEAVCAADPFCCNVEWDNFCVGGAYQACCPADIAPVQGDNQVNVLDILAVINGWGECAGLICASDIFPAGGDDFTNVQDLIFVINNWGPCE